MRHPLPSRQVRFETALRITAGALVLLPFGYLASSAWRLPPVPRFVASLLVSAALGLFIIRIARTVWRWCTTSISAAAIPGHQAADRQLSLSFIESLIVAGQHETAGEEIERMLTEHGMEDAGLCRLAVNYHLRVGGDAARGEALLRRMRSSHPEKYDAFATQRLIDLLLRNTDAASRAIPELHRLAQRSPGSMEAEGALAAIERLREQVRLAHRIEP